nr:hypothetical protein [Microbacterium hydrocarbonoxydans]
MSTEAVEHPLPTTATVKRMYATAFRCGHPKCNRPLYRMNDVSGDLTLNSTVAHIHARREGGPRWEPGMSGEDNRSEANLVLLCLEHSREVDAIPDDYPAEEMQSWKLTVRADYNKVQQSWALTEDQVAEVFAASFEVREFARTAVESESLTQTQRLGGALIEEAKKVRRRAHAVANSWRELCDRLTRETMAWDQDGELLQVHPPQNEKQRYRTEMIAALTAAHAELEPRVNSLAAELRALRATNVDLAPWCEWVDREARAVLTSATTAPSLDDVPQVETQGLSDALDALASVWRGETADEPPAISEPAVDPDQDAAAKERAAHSAAINAARPWRRVDSRPYDAEIYDRLIARIPYSINLPRVASNLATDLVAVAICASAVARNASDEILRARIEEAAAVEPLAGAIALLDNLASVAEESGRSDLRGLAAKRADERLSRETWLEPAVWDTNAFYARTLLNRLAAGSGVAHVSSLIRTGIAGAPPEAVLLMLASWTQSFSIWEEGTDGALMPKITTLPDWLPKDVARGILLKRWPDLEPSDSASEDVARRLAAELLLLLDHDE